MDSATDVDRGHVLWASDPFKADADAERPLVVLTDDTHPFHGEQRIAAGVSTVPRPRTLELTLEEWTQESLPQRSYVCIRRRCSPHGSSGSTTSSGASRESSSTK